ncbi:MAG: tetraacyldisaccharide 4'-kinase, partial [Rhodospirillaceae bacterium]
MQAPEFWWTDGALGRMLDPLGAFYALATKRRVARPPSFSPPVPVLSIGNLVAGGAGKTPLALAAAAWLKEQGAQPI